MPLIQSSGNTPGCLSRQPWLVAKLQDIPPFRLGKAATHIREFLFSLNFDEILLGPIETHPVSYLNDTVDVPEIGQLRFNTEPEIWASSNFSDRYYSISTLFRRETIVNCLRRSAFFIVDIYQHGTPDTVLSIFHAIISRLAEKGFTEKLSTLPFTTAQYDPSTDGPLGPFDQTRWAITTGYDASHSFFEVDEHGQSTRREIFLVTPFGFLEIGVLGITGWNRNPQYIMRKQNYSEIMPDVRRSGICIGLERLLLAEQIVSIVRASDE